LLGVTLAGVLIVYEHSLVKPTDLTRVNQAFFHVNAAVSVGLLVVVLVDLAVGVDGRQMVTQNALYCP